MPALVMSLSRPDYDRIKLDEKRMAHKSGTLCQRAYIAFGSNVGQSVSHIEMAAKLMEEREILVWRTSAMYQTKPMYLEDQRDFLNGVFEIETDMTPANLLKKLKSIEKELGRIKGIENGPRPIDLDILLYGKETVNTSDLIIPHARIMEREFVLKPLCE
ncbi:uncharacterized protein KY384_003362 [Bacidia gigantensis]|uniref:uncharacterized protein n=1 Tax=Bacidia gigantensis TaxID=2732470 RepID=UPI001D057957|nr:uncharacterized protein KY384_003362 [Bacidia gigantensis]KAG8531730.1 hypothetical protein KY384_003362 [Bacidia gigantensis]